MKRPHGTPSSACPTVSTASESDYKGLISLEAPTSGQATHKEGDEDCSIHED